MNAASSSSGQVWTLWAFKGHWYGVEVLTIWGNDLQPLSLAQPSRALLPASKRPARNQSTSSVQCLFVVRGGRNI